MSLASPDQSPTLPPEISTSHLCLAAESTFSVGRSTRMVKKSLVENATFSYPGQALSPSVEPAVPERLCCSTPWPGSCRRRTASSG